MLRLFGSLWREPLLHFIVLAVLLFALEHVFSSTQKETIVVDRQMVNYLIQQREDLHLRKLTAEERRQTIDAFVEDEILYKEAYRRGLDKGDSRMRRNLILKLRGLLIGDLEAPNEQELRGYFEARRADFALAATVSLEQLFFSEPGQVPEGLLTELRAAGDPATVAETWSGSGLMRKLPGRTQREIVSTFGVEAARAILAIDDGQWHGPIESIHGVHFVRIVGREPAREVSYEEARPYLEADWMMTRSREAVGQEIERLRDRYAIIIEGGEETTP